MSPAGASGKAGIDATVATALGFPKPEYVAVERERRFLCRAIPHERIVTTEAITDLYVEGTRLRLREARPENGGAAMLRLSRKADIDTSTRLVSSVYLTEEEFALLSRSLTGVRISKKRHRLKPDAGVELLIDAFEGPLAGLLLAEAQADSEAALAAFPMPDFALREVTGDERFTGAALARHGRPAS